MHANINVHSRRLISEFPKYEIKCIEKLQSHCANMTFADKSRYDRIFQQVTHKLKILQKNAIRNILHANIDVHSRILISGFPRDGIKCIEKLQSHCANMNFADKSIYDRTFQQVTHKGGEFEINYIKRFQNTHALSVSVGNSYSED